MLFQSVSLCIELYYLFRKAKFLPTKSVDKKYKHVSFLKLFSHLNYFLFFLRNLYMYKKERNQEGLLKTFDQFGSNL